MATGFGNWATTQEFKKVLADIVATEINKHRPATRLAQVASINKDTRTLGVIFAGETNEVQVPYTSIAPANLGQYVRIGGTTHDRYVEDVIGQNDTDRRLEFAEGQINSLMTTAIGDEWKEEDSDNLGGLLGDFFDTLGGSGNPQELLDLIGGKIGATVEEAKDRFEALVQGAFGQVDPSRLAEVPWGNLSAITPNLLNNPGFDSEVAIEGESVWTWDSEVGRTTPGSATTTCDGTLKTLTSNEIKCTPGQKFEFGGWVRWTGIAASGLSFQLMAVPYLNGSPQGSTQMGAVSNPAANNTDWSFLGNTYTVPAGTDAVRLRLIVNAAVTSGQVWWDDLLAAKTGAIPQSAVNNLVDDLGKFPILGDLAEGITGIEDGDLNDIGTMFLQLRTLLQGGSIGSPVPNLVGSLNLGNLNTTLTQISQVFNQEVVTPINNEVQKVKDWFADLLGWQDDKTNEISTTDSVAQYAQTIADSTVINLVSNKPISVSLDPTATPSFEWQLLSERTGVATSTNLVTSSIARITKIRFRLDQIVNTVSFLAYKTDNPALYADLYRYRRETNDWQLYYSSANLSPSISGALNRITFQFSDGYPVSAGDLIAIQFRCAGSGSFSVAMRNFPVAPAVGFVPGAGGGSRNPTTDPAPTLITNATMESYNDGNTIWAEIGSNLGQLQLPRSYYINFNNLSWQGWVRNTAGGSQLQVEGGGWVGYGGGNDAVQLAVYGSQTSTDKMEAQFNVRQTNAIAPSMIYICNNNSPSMSDGNGVFLYVFSNELRISVAGNQKATASGSFSPGSYKIQYVPSENTYYGLKYADGYWSPYVSWTDSTNIISHGVGKRYGGIGIGHLAFTAGGEIDEVHIRDTEDMAA